jgi:restriction endonuclease S subunit
MGMNIQHITLSSSATHKDLRCGLGLPSFIRYVNEFKTNGNKYLLIKLGKVISLEYGNALKEDDRIPGDYPVMGSNGAVGTHEDYLIEGPAIIVGRKGSAGEVTYEENNCFPIDTTFYVKQKDHTFNTRFLYFLLNKLKLQRLALFKGVPGLNRYDAYEAYIPLIPLPVQKKILEKAQPFETEIQFLQSKLLNPTDVIQSVFAEEFNVPEILYPKKFMGELSALSFNSEMRLGTKHAYYSPELAKVLSKIGRFYYLKNILFEEPLYGSNQAGIDSESDDDIRYLRITDVDDIGNLLNDEIKTVKKIDDKYILSNNDFLFARSGNTVGKSFLYKEEIHPNLLFAGYFIKFKIDFSNLNPEFFLYYSKSPIFSIWKNSIVRIMGQPNINADEYKLLPIIDIPLKRQLKITEKIKNQLVQQKGIKQAIKQKQNEISKIIEKAIKI